MIEGASLDGLGKIKQHRLGFSRIMSSTKCRIVFVTEDRVQSKPRNRCAQSTKRGLWAKGCRAVQHEGTGNASFIARRLQAQFSCALASVLKKAAGSKMSCRFPLTVPAAKFEAQDVRAEAAADDIVLIFRCGRCLALTREADMCLRPQEPVQDSLRVSPIFSTLLLFSRSWRPKDAYFRHVFGCMIREGRKEGSRLPWRPRSHVLVQGWILI